MLINGAPLTIRVDANSNIGSGHLMRSLALGAAWKRVGGVVTFLSNIDSQPLRDKIERQGFSIRNVTASHPSNDDLKQTIAALQDNASPMGRPTWVVVDGYHFDPSYHNALIGAGFRVLVIDDMKHLSSYRVDAVLNQNLAGEHTLDYPEATQSFRGLQYVLLRPEFIDPVPMARQFSDQPRRLLVTMGGSDRDNITERVVTSLVSAEGGAYEVRVLIGPANPHRSKLSRLIAECSHITAVINPETVRPHMEWCDLAITAAGSTCWELAFLETPMLTFVLAENQELVAQALDEAGAGINLGYCTDRSCQALMAAIADLVSSSQKLREMGQRGRQLIDGRGADRVVAALQTIA